MYLISPDVYTSLIHAPILPADKSRLTFASCAVYSVGLTSPLSSTYGVKTKALLKSVTLSPQLLSTSAFRVPLTATRESVSRTTLTASETFFVFSIFVSVVSTDSTISRCLSRYGTMPSLKIESILLLSIGRRTKNCSPFSIARPEYKPSSETKTVAGSGNAEKSLFCLSSSSRFSILLRTVGSYTISVPKACIRAFFNLR